MKNLTRADFLINSHIACDATHLQPYTFSATLMLALNTRMRTLGLIIDASINVEYLRAAAHLEASTHPESATYQWLAQAHSSDPALNRMVPQAC